MSDHHHHDEINVPKPFLIGATLMVVTIVVLTAISSWTGFGQSQSEMPAAVDQLAVNFFDEDDGGVGVYHAETGEPLKIYEAGSGNFIRIAVRSLAAKREMSGIGKTPPFELIKTEAGRIFLHDPSTEKFLALRAFGQGNADDFAELFATSMEGDDI